MKRTGSAVLPHRQPNRLFFLCINKQTIFYSFSKNPLIASGFPFKDPCIIGGFPPPFPSKASFKHLPMLRYCRPFFQAHNENPALASHKNAADTICLFHGFVDKIPHGCRVHFLCKKRRFATGFSRSFCSSSLSAAFTNCSWQFFILFFQSCKFLFQPFRPRTPLPPALQKAGWKSALRWLPFPDNPKAPGIRSAEKDACRPYTVSLL